MPHYTDFNGLFAELPAASGEFWGYLYTNADLANASTTIEWTTHEANSTPGLAVQLPNESFWQSNQFARPEALAVMADPSFSNSGQTDYKVWDVAWDQLGFGVASPRVGTVSLQQLITEANDAQTQPQGIEHVYFQVNALPVELNLPALSLPGTLVLAISLLGAALFASVRRRRSRHSPAL